MPSSKEARWWLAMPPDRLRVAIAVMCDLRSEPEIDLDLHRLSTALDTSKSTTVRAIEDLERLGLINRKTTAGRTGGTRIRRLVADWFTDSIPASNSSTVTTQNSNKNISWGDSADSIQGSIPEHFQQPVLLDLSNPTKNSDPDSDLLCRTPTHQEERTVTDAMPTPPNETTETNPQGKRPKIDPAKIPSPAWRAADGLRAQILKHDPEHKLGTVKWDGETSGMRLKWAHTFDLMNRIDRRDWGEIGGVIRWLYPDDAQKGPTQAAAMFVIFSPDSLREKFDRVQAARKREHTGAGPRTPDTRQPPAFKSWGQS